MDTDKNNLLKKLIRKIFTPSEIWASDKRIAATITSALPFMKGPSTVASALRGYGASRDANIIKNARAYEGAPNLGGMSGREPTDAMKARALARKVIEKRVGKERAASGINAQALKNH